MKAKGSQSVKLFGTGNETRDYIFILDIARALNCIVEGALFKGECYNLGYGTQYSLKDVAMRFYEYLGWHGNLLFSGETREGDPVHLHADIRKLTNIGFSPEISIDEGLNEYAKWVQSEPSE